LYARVGQIIYDYRRPRSGLGEPLELPSASSASYVNRGCEIISITSDAVDSVSLDSRVLDFVGFRLKGDSEKSKVRQLLLEKIEITELNPSSDYVENSFKQSAVQNHLKRTKFRSPLYMICARKVALGGAKALDQIKKGQSFEGTAEVPFDIHGGKVAKATASGLHERRKERRHDIYTTHPFVFAYRLREIVYDPKLKNEPYDREVLRFHSALGRPLTGKEVEEATADFVDLEEYAEGYTLVDEIETGDLENSEG
jgi:hypothetical protein